jgi:dTMP kinase
VTGGGSEADSRGPVAPRGFFIAFEGTEGCGKSTQIERLAAHLARIGRDALVTREPGGTPLGEILRRVLLDPAGAGIDGWSELFLLEAARHAHVEQVIRPALDRGLVVISDRFADSSVAYQGGGRGLDLEQIEALNRIATAGLMPDLTILLDIEVEEGLRRIARRDASRDRVEQEQIEFHRRVREAYRRLSVRRGSAYVQVDGARPPDEIEQAIRARLAACL